MVSLSTAGKISGTPTTVGTFNFTVKTTNTVGSDTKALSIFVEEGVGIVENELSGITIFPNPTTGELRMENGKLTISVELFDVFGRKLLSHTANHSPHTVLDIAHLPTGISKELFM